MENNSLKTISFRNLQIVFWTLIGAQVIFLLLSTIVVTTNDYSVSDSANQIFSIFTPIVVVVSILAGLAINFIRIKSIRKITNIEERYQKFSSNNIIGWACIEGATIMSILSYFITHQMQYFYLSILILLFFITTYPTKQRVIKALNLQAGEEKILD